MCHQSVGLIARHLEAAGYSTIGFSSAWSITESVKPPRSVFVDAPLGHTTGPPNSPELQRQLLAEGLRVGAAIETPGTIEALPYRWIDDGWKAHPFSWTRRAQEAGTANRPSGDSRSARSREPVYQNDADRIAAESSSFEDHCLTCLGIGS